MNTHEFKQLAKGKDFLRVVATSFEDSHVIVSAILICDEPDYLTPYNFLRGDKGQILKFDHTEEAVTAIRMFGYKGEITFIRDRQRVN